MKKGLQACGGRQVQYDLEFSPGWNLVYAEPPTPEHAAWVYGRREATGRCPGTEAGAVPAPLPCLSYKAGKL